MTLFVSVHPSTDNGSHRVARISPTVTMLPLEGAISGVYERSKNRIGVSLRIVLSVIVARSVVKTESGLRSRIWIGRCPKNLTRAYWRFPRLLRHCQIFEQHLPRSQALSNHARRRLDPIVYNPIVALVDVRSPIFTSLIEWKCKNDYHAF
jgi:hypothetical protein